MKFFKKEILSLFGAAAVIGGVGGVAIVSINSPVSSDNVPASTQFEVRAQNGFVLDSKTTELGFYVFDNIYQQKANNVKIEWQTDTQDGRNNPDDLQDFTKLVKINGQSDGSCKVSIDKNIYYGTSRGTIYFHIKAKITKPGNDPEMASTGNNRPIQLTGIDVSQTLKLDIQNPIMNYIGRTASIPKLTLTVNNSKATVPFNWDTTLPSVVVDSSTLNLNNFMTITGENGETDLSKSPSVREIHFKDLPDATSWDTTFTFNFGGNLTDNGQRYNQVITVMPKSDAPLPYDMNVKLTTPDIFEHINAPLTNATDIRTGNSHYTEDNDHNRAKMDVNLTWNGFGNEYSAQYPDGLPAPTWDGTLSVETAPGTFTTAPVNPFDYRVNNDGVHELGFNKTAINTDAPLGDWTKFFNHWNGGAFFMGFVIPAMTFYCDGNPSVYFPNGGTSSDTYTTDAIHFYQEFDLREFTRISRISANTDTEINLSYGTNTIQFNPIEFVGSDIILNNGQPNVLWKFYSDSACTKEITNPQDIWQCSKTSLSVSHSETIKTSPCGPNTIDFTTQGTATVTFTPPTSIDDEHNNPAAEFWTKVSVNGVDKDNYGNDKHQEVDPSSSVVYHINVAWHDFYTDAIQTQIVQGTNARLIGIDIDKAKACGLLQNKVLSIPSQLRIGPGANDIENITNIKAGAIPVSAEIEKIVLPPTLKVLEDMAFYSNTNVNEITIQGQDFDYVGGSSLATLTTTKINSQNTQFNTICESQFNYPKDPRNKNNDIHYDFVSNQNLPTQHHDNSNTSYTNSAISPLYSVRYLSQTDQFYTNTDLIISSCIYSFGSSTHLIFGNNNLDTLFQNMPQTLSSSSTDTYNISQFHWLSFRANGHWAVVVGGVCSVDNSIVQTSNFNVSYINYKSYNNTSYQSKKATETNVNIWYDANPGGSVTWFAIEGYAELELTNAILIKKGSTIVEKHQFGDGFVKVHGGGAPFLSGYHTTGWEDHNNYNPITNDANRNFADTRSGASAKGKAYAYVYNPISGW